MCQSKLLHQLALQRDPINGCDCPPEEKAAYGLDSSWIGKNLGRITITKADLTPHPHAHSADAVWCGLCGNLQKAVGLKHQEDGQSFGTDLGQQSVAQNLFPPVGLAGSGPTGQAQAQPTELRDEDMGNPSFRFRSEEALANMPPARLAALLRAREKNRQ